MGNKTLRFPLSLHMTKAIITKVTTIGRFLLSVVRSYAPGCEPLVTGNLAMGLTIVPVISKSYLQFTSLLMYCTVYVYMKLSGIEA